jgi:hypothetical protein
VRLVSGCREHATDGARDGAHARTAARELSARLAQLLEKILASGDGLLAQLRERLDRAAGHPAGSVRAVVKKFLDSLGEDGVHECPQL